ncbi:K(+)-transporting ATPase subunit C [Nocardiopsis halophila]|uniref:K(+)-transporting ATPase subunit C n=1 Tax=Nocardiopsis halophila TaxID=141692 RepID=UPI0003480090|nr:K(+)-transporting ATPase subunit C [Nocardiopsis halophila]
MLRQLFAAGGMVAVSTVVTGLLYPLAVTGVAQAAFDDKADGSMVERDGEAVGSSLIGQSFEGQGYFHPRPSAIGYDPADSGGSNLGPSDEGLLEDIETRTREYREANGLADGAEVPVDAVTGSGSGLDPHISVANARLQASRVAEARGMGAGDVTALVDEHTAGRALGILGEKAVNVLELNAALDEAAPLN